MRLYRNEPLFFSRDRLPDGRPLLLDTLTLTGGTIEPTANTVIPYQMEELVLTMSADLAALFDPVKFIGKRSPRSGPAVTQYVTLGGHAWTRLSHVTLRGVYTSRIGGSRIVVVCELSRLEFNLHCLEWLFGWPSYTMSDAATGRIVPVLRLEGGDKLERFLLHNALNPNHTRAQRSPILCADPVFEAFAPRQSPIAARQWNSAPQS